VSRAAFRRPDGRDGSYGQWAAEVAAKWSALSAGEQSASRDAAVTRLSAQIKAQDEGPTLLHIYDEIGWFGVWAADVVDALGGIKGDVEVHLNSPGGDVFDGLAIYAALRQHSGQVGMVVDGLAASAASFIAMAASPGQLAMTPNGTMMIHDAWGMCMGNAADMRDMVSLLEDSSENIASIYAERSGLTAVECRDLMKAETWAVGQRAVDLRLADTVRQPAGDAAQPLQVAASLPWQVTITAEAPAPAAPPPASDGTSNQAGMPAWLSKALTA
jgi:ATP-dependent protease ClpP protease subunit